MIDSTITYDELKRYWYLADSDHPSLLTDGLKTGCREHPLPVHSAYFLELGNGRVLSDLI